MSVLPIICDQTMNVYARGSSGDTSYSTLILSGVACRLNFMARRPGATGPERADLGSSRILVWDADVPISEDAQIEVIGVPGVSGAGTARWNFQRGTSSLLRGPLGDPHYWTCYVTRAVR